MKSSVVLKMLLSFSFQCVLETIFIFFFYIFWKTSGVNNWCLLPKVIQVTTVALPVATSPVSTKLVEWNEMEGRQLGGN